ncbi:MAG: hypothetical protein ACI3XA_03675 [Clostridia bacterium]
MRKGLWFGAICVIAFIGGITAGFISSRISLKEPIHATEERVEAVNNEEETLPHTVTKETDYYYVCIEGESLVVFEVFDDNTQEEIGRTFVEYANIPQSDKVALSEGIAFEEREEALMLIEDFVS